MIRFLIIAWLVCAPRISSADAAKVEAGKKAFVTCGACHSIDGSAKPLGPTLKNVVGRKAASDAGYKRYSKALRDSGIAWSEAELDAYLKAPSARVKGTTMMIALPDDARRAAVIAYLKTLK
jgi:cytochrome c